ncbi:ferrochelatase [Pseudactinotalea sp. HY160]|uniref:ferrochelatase n=1 Tax=Pseudactinotalea sp. HY160 TaxID=2654490 RepID=UPI00351B93A8
MKPAPATGVHLAAGARVPSASPAAAAGEAHVSAPTSYDAVLLAGFGGPEGQADVLPFLRNVTAGRGIPDERLEEVAVHYRHFGGVSPINGHNRQLREALEAALAAAGLDLPVYWGNRNWDPYLTDAVRAAHDAGHTRLLMIPTSAYASYSSCRQYREDLADVLEATGLAEAMEVDKVRQFFDHPGFVTPFVEGVRAGLADLRARGAERIEVLFATHSIPIDDARRSGPALLPDGHASDWGDGGAYAAQHLAVAGVVMDSLDEPGAGWQLTYQSRSGPPDQPWLEPDINDAIEALTDRDAVLIVPLGFLSDHMEVMWDLDEEATETATARGLACARVPTPGVHPDFVRGLVDLVAERAGARPVAERAALTDLGPWFDVCRPGCCENVRRGFRPAIAGVAP